MHHKDFEIVVFVGIKISDPAFKGLPKRDRDHLRGMAGIPQVPLRPIFRHGEIVGFGIPIIIADARDNFEEVSIETLFAEVEKAKTKFRELVHRVAVPPEPKCYAPKLMHKQDAVA